ncbi:hypothetical protein BBK82_05065 [Lentzea guizhouensis]|uniref:HTH merR-type domain-containing protein n=1 Tax=Lentzea guizhouensis TaxID=1586287 RepID=A0A1B2HCU7_9PSEU|nr:hypothetical protein [Lentzea guizhouensis]ANZ35543.1 hypothetical protein BBK82_05065 [Lentzea guizhouensis]
MNKARVRELGEREPVADAEALQVMLGGVPVGTLQRWAQDDGWPRRHSTTSRGRRTEYSIRAAKQSYERRRGPLDEITSGEVTSGHVGDLSLSDGAGVT